MSYKWKDIESKGEDILSRGHSSPQRCGDMKGHISWPAGIAQYALQNVHRKMVRTWQIGQGVQKPGDGEINESLTRLYLSTFVH